MDYLKNITEVESVGENYLYKSGDIGLFAYCSHFIDGEVYFYTRIDVRSGDISRFAFKNKNSYEQFLLARSKTKGIQIKLLNYFSNLSPEERGSLLEGGLKIKGFTSKTLEKLRISECILLDRIYPHKVYTELYSILNKQSNDTDKIQSFLETEGLDKLDKDTLNSYFMSYLLENG